jgi:hypothetical protein
VVTGLKVSYDTLKQIVTLTWNKADTALAKGYYVYRRNVDSNTILTRIDANLITDTLYRDSTGVQNMTYEYKVAAVSKADMEGTKSVAASWKFINYLNIDTVFTGGSLFHFVKDIAISKSGNIYSVEESNNRIRIFTRDMVLKHEYVFGDTINTPQRVALDSVSNAYVLMLKGSSTALNYKTVIVLDSLCNVIDTLNIQGDNIFTLTASDSVMALFLNGQRKRIWGGSGSVVGKYLSPSNICVDTSYRIFISDQDNSRVQVSDTLGTVVKTIDFPDWTDNVIFDNKNQRLYVGYGSRLLGSKIRAFDSQFNLIAEYKYLADYSLDKITRLSTLFH